VLTKGKEKRSYLLVDRSVKPLGPFTVLALMFFDDSFGCP
jgi:hypothetical protein